MTDETRGLLIESYRQNKRSDKAMNAMRHKMAREIHADITDDEARRRYYGIKSAIQAVLAGFAGVATSELLFQNEDWWRSLGFGAFVLTGTAIAEYTQRPRRQLL